MYIFSNRIINCSYTFSRTFFVASSILSASLVFSQPNLTQDPSKAGFVMEDAELFLSVFNELDAESDTLSVLQKEYLDKGSIGLQEYIQRHGLTAEMMVKAIQKSPERYLAIGPLLEQIKMLESEYRNLCEEYAKVVDGTVFAPTYFLVAANRGIAQASTHGQLVSVTIFTKSSTYKKLLPTIIHELTHFQQARTMGIQKYIGLYGPERTDDLLGFAIREGVAEFITSLVTNSITQSKTLKYYENQNQKEFWKNFNLDVKNASTTGWLWDTVGKENHLMAYVMGYKISEAYYDKAENKAGAINELLMAENESVIFEESGQYISTE